MYGEDGWCRTCGLPKHSQSGSIVLQRKGLKLEGAWVPNWQFDVYCAVQLLAEEARERFHVDLRPVASVGSGRLDASQIVVESTSHPWFNPDDLDRLIKPIHGVSAETCATCATTRWMPVGMDVLPPPPDQALAAEPPVVASPEWFGAGMRSFRQILWRRDVADFLVKNSPKDFKTQELTW